MKSDALSTLEDIAKEFAIPVEKAGDGDGWVSRKGFFIPVQTYQHDNMCYDIEDIFMEKTKNPLSEDFGAPRVLESVWVRVSHSRNSPEDVPTMLQIEGKPTARQKTTLLKLFTQQPSRFGARDYNSVYGSGLVIVRHQDGSIRMEKELA